MGMEDETRDFFVKILNSMSVVLLWMILNVLFGIYYNYAFFDDYPNWKNYIFYLLSVASFIWVLKYLYKKWK
jgi:hypothetical protein